MAKVAVYPDADTEKTFKAEQAKREEPKCFGDWNKPIKGRCGRCWFSPECKANTKDFAARKKKLDEDIAAEKAEKDKLK